MKRITIVLILSFIGLSISAQSIAINDLIVTSTTKTEHSAVINIPNSFIEDKLDDYDINNTDLKHIEVIIDLLNGSDNTAHFWYYNDYQSTNSYSFEYEYSDDYEKTITITHDQSAGSKGDYPNKLGIKLALIEFHLNDGTTVPIEYTQGDTQPVDTYYMYWNKNSNVNKNITIYGATEGNTIDATASYNGGDYPMTYYWNIYVKDGVDNSIKHTLFENYSTGNNNKLEDIQIPYETNGDKLSFYYKVVLNQNSSHFVEHYEEFVIKPWNDGMSFDLESSNMQICYGNQSTFSLNYSENEIPDYVMYNWQVSSNLQILSSTKTSITVKANTNTGGFGNVTLTYTNVPTIQSENIWVGKPSFSLTPIDYVMQTMEPGITIIDYYGATDYTFQGVNRVDWSYTGPIMMINGDLTKAYFTTDRRGGIGYIYADVYNSCGSIENRTFFEVEDGFVMYGPNPADEEIVISLVSDTESLQSYSTSKETVDTNEEIATLILYDQNSNMIFNDKLSGKKKEVKWNTSNLKNGTYLLHINKKNETNKKQIIIEHK